MTEFDVIVVGGGHAGLEASFASAHMGQKTLLISLDFNMVGHMPCNPSIGGSAKGIVVREIDALGGVMAKHADYRYLQMKMLNTGKGPGVQCLRAQNDRILYRETMKESIKTTENLHFIDGMVVDLLHDESHVFGVVLDDNRKITSKAVVLSTGTYLEGEILIGHSKHPGGPDGQKAAIGLSDSLKKMGLEIIRLKTGTPPRIKRSSIDFSKTISQYGSTDKLAFSYETNEYVPFEEQVPCYLIYTTPHTHEIIKSHLDDTALFSGNITGIGPRYCPSIESKIMMFKDKERHQLFLEPEGHDLSTIYLQGFSTSMDSRIQEDMVHSLPGLEHAEILKYAYAIQYDAVMPTELKPTLETKKYSGLYLAGQISGTSGYEEAAGLGLMAGINACLKIQNKKPLILRRDEAYIGVMIDDIVTKGITEPYRLLSSRAEYRLLLRHDNADIRLTKKGYEIGLISHNRYEHFMSNQEKIKQVISILSSTYLGTKQNVTDYLISIGYEPLRGGVSGVDLLRRQNVKLSGLKNLIPALQQIELDNTVTMQIEVMVKYEGYIEKQKQNAETLQKLELIEIPNDVDYLHMDGLALEARQKMDKIRPLTIAQASRISGVNPSDIAVLIIHLKKGK